MYSLSASRREVADGVERDLRVVGARLDAEVAAAAGRVELVAREGWEIHERRRSELLEAAPA
jgi:hypothetical protein